MFMLKSPRGARELEAGEKHSFVKRARGTCRAGVPLRPDRKGEEATSTKKKQVHKAGESAFMIESGSFCTVEGVKASAFGFPPEKPGE